MAVWSTLNGISKLNAVIHIFESYPFPWIYKYLQNITRGTIASPVQHHRSIFGENSVARGIIFPSQIQTSQAIRSNGFSNKNYNRSIRFMFSPLIAVVISIPYHSRDPVSALLSLVIHISPLHHVSISPEKYHKPKKKIARTKIGQKYLNQFVFFFLFFVFSVEKKERKKEKKIFYVKIRSNLVIQKKNELIIQEPE